MSLEAIILAAGEGKRMLSAKTKVLHEVAGLSMVGHAVKTAQAAGVSKLSVIIGPNREDVGAEVLHHAPDVQLFTQDDRKGTGHAVLQARAMLEKSKGAVLVLFGDTPLVRAETIQALADAVNRPNIGVAVFGFRAKDPTGYGRLLMKEGALQAIREHKDASESERQVNLCNGGLMALRGEQALALLDQIDNNNQQQEYYLTDVVEIAQKQGLGAVVVEVEEEEALGVNDRLQLSVAEAVMQRRLRRKAMLAGVTLQAPETVTFSYDTELAADVTIEPHVVFGRGVKVESNVIIHAFSHLEGATLASGVSIGPYARLRPGSKLAEGAKIGNFVEIKNAAIEAGAKVNHLSYIGDARVGAKANIGAGTITCNYDGFNKFKTDVGAGVFVGSNTALVAPVSIGDGANIGAGSVITKDVPAGSLAVARGSQRVIEGWATKFRAKMAALKGK